MKSLESKPRVHLVQRTRFKLLSFLAFARFYSRTKLQYQNLPNLKLLPCCVEAIRSTNTVLSHPVSRLRIHRHTDIQTDSLSAITRGTVARLRLMIGYFVVKRTGY